MPEEGKTLRVARIRTADGKYAIENDELLNHSFKAIAFGSMVKFRNVTTGEVHEQECTWCQDLVTNQTMFIPSELLEETE
jgi:hypothetical protein